MIDGAIGELSPFHDTFGYYAQGVEPGTAILPEGWEARVVIVTNTNTRGAKGLCLEPHDLVVSKCIAGREKDLAFLRSALEHRLVDRATLLDRLARTSIDDARRRLARTRIEVA